VSQYTKVIIALTISVIWASRAAGRVVVIPTAANASGQFGAYFKTKVVILPLGSGTPFYITLQVLPSQGTSGRSSQVLLTPGIANVYPDVLGWLGYSGGAGIEVLYPEDQDIAVSAEVYVDGPSGRYSTLVPTLDLTHQTFEANRAVSLGVTSNANTRVNVGCSSLNNQGASVTADIRAANGSPVGLLALFVPAYGWAQAPVPYTVTDGYINWSGQFNAAYVFCFAINVNNRSNDGTYLR
jgi:hypothetical protein